MSDLSALARYYAEAADEELREARRRGPEAYRPDAWSVIQAELERRQLPAERSRKRRGVRAGRAVRPRERAEWTAGLKIGMVAAGAAVIYVVRMMYEARMGGRGALHVLAVFFFVVWFAVALLIDWRDWLPRKRR